MNLLSILFIFALVSFSGNLHARTSEVIEISEKDIQNNETKDLNTRWHLGIGNYFDMPSTYQTTSSGDKNSYELWPIVNWGRSYGFESLNWALLQWNLMGSIPKTVGKSDLTRTIISFEILLGLNSQGFGKIFSGISFFEQCLYFKESGATNTEGSSTFYRPDRVAWVSQQALVVSYQTPVVYDHFLGEIKSYTLSLWDSERREQSYALNLNYLW